MIWQNGERSFRSVGCFRRFRISSRSCDHEMSMPTALWNCVNSQPLLMHAYWCEKGGHMHGGLVRKPLHHCARLVFCSFLLEKKQSTHPVQFQGHASQQCPKNFSDLSCVLMIHLPACGYLGWSVNLPTVPPNLQDARAQYPELSFVYSKQFWLLADFLQAILASQLLSIDEFKQGT